jgi:hypothetical protein
MVAFAHCKGAAMLNIRINVMIDVRKWVVSLVAAVMVWGQLFSPATALPTEPKPEAAVKVSLTYMNVVTTKSEAVKALKSPYVKYFDAQAIAFLTEYAHGESMAEWKCLNSLWNGESHFNPKALNMSSHAYGIAQFLPTTWANYKVEKTPVAQLQIKYGLRYIKVRYGSPKDPSGACNAIAFWNAHGWY